MWLAAREPVPPVSVIHALVVAPSPQLTIAVWVSRVPTSVNVPETETDWPSTAPPLQQGELFANAAITGATFAIVVVVLPLAAPVSSSVSVTPIVYTSLAVPVGLSSRY